MKVPNLLRKLLGQGYHNSSIAIVDEGKTIQLALFPYIISVVLLKKLSPTPNTVIFRESFLIKITCESTVDT